MPVSPVTGRLDAFQWKDPVADLHAEEAVIEHDRGPRTVDLPAPAAPPPPSANVTELRPLEARTAETPSPAPPSSAPPVSAVRGLVRTAPAAAPVVPLVPVPDDPGPDPQPQLEPETDTPSSSGDSWRKLRGLFK
jgi:HemY protein